VKPVPERRVLISGVAGFLGSHLADALLADGWEVVGVDNLIGGYLDNVPAGVSFHRADCNDLASMRALMEGVGVVYHCAATAYEGLSVFSPHFVTRNVVTATTGMMSAAIASRVRRFVFCSSMARYGAIAVPFTEDAEPRPQDPYGIGKLPVPQRRRDLHQPAPSGAPGRHLRRRLAEALLQLRLGRRRAFAADGDGSRVRRRGDQHRA
jgi:nucleoside-diphosphate-sugar epimerase